jgi:SlyX protein
MPDEMSERFEKIEAHVAHLEHQVEQLNEVVTSQGKLVEFLKKQVQRQSNVLETMELENIKTNNAPPPHH